jgi:hypothetical protein
MEVPDQWNDELIMYAHGWNTTRPLNVRDLPIREDAIQQGFIWAASSFHTGGYNPDDGMRHTLIRREHFQQKVGVPNRTFIDGTSMGEMWSSPRSSSI